MFVRNKCKCWKMYLNRKIENGGGMIVVVFNIGVFTAVKVAQISAFIMEKFYIFFVFQGILY